LFVYNSSLGQALVIFSEHEGFNFPKLMEQGQKVTQEVPPCPKLQEQRQKGNTGIFNVPEIEEAETKR